jgi:hypothetical protein
VCATAIGPTLIHAVAVGRVRPTMQPYSRGSCLAQGQLSTSSELPLNLQKIAGTYLDYEWTIQGQFAT